MSVNSWVAIVPGQSAIDQMLPGVADEFPKLMLVSAGNFAEIRDA
jgi:hypothetical protein